MSAQVGVMGGLDVLVNNGELFASVHTMLRHRETACYGTIG